MAAPTAEEIAELMRIDREFAIPERGLRAYAFDDTRSWIDPRGYRLSDRVWQARIETRRQIDAMIRQALATGEDALVLADALERYLDPSLLPRRDETGALVPNQRKGIVTFEPKFRVIAGSKRPGAGSFPARRLARTEISRAHAQATVESVKRTPFMRGVRWLLSGRHPKADQCNDRAEHDAGHGPGVYSADEAPPMPAHPMCLCVWAPAPVEDTDAVIAALRQQYGLAPEWLADAKSDLTRRLDALPETATFPPEPPGFPGFVKTEDGRRLTWRESVVDQRWRNLGWTPPKVGLYGKTGSRDEIQVFRGAISAYAEPNGVRSYTTLRRTLEDFAQFGKTYTTGMEAEAKLIARTIAEADPIPSPLYRGTFSRSLDPPAPLGAVGDIISLPGTSSFSVKQEIADGFRTGTGAGSGEHLPKGPNHETSFVVLPGAHGIKVDSLTIWEQGEVITGGEFEIVDIQAMEGKRKNGRRYTHTTYTLRQTAVLAPIA